MEQEQAVVVVVVVQMDKFVLMVFDSDIVQGGIGFYFDLVCMDSGTCVRMDSPSMCNHVLAKQINPDTLAFFIREDANTEPYFFPYLQRETQVKQRLASLLKDEAFMSLLDCSLFLYYIKTGQVLSHDKEEPIEIERRRPCLLHEQDGEFLDAGTLIHFVSNQDEAICHTAMIIGQRAKDAQPFFLSKWGYTGMPMIQTMDQIAHMFNHEYTEFIIEKMNKHKV
jgi:hypothetical protein